jgi:O-antigen/teichoic acid export membrane protein
MWLPSHASDHFHDGRKYWSICAAIWVDKMLARVAKNAAAQILAQLVQFADRFLVVGILLRAWGTQVYSEWALLLSCASMLSLGELGLNIYFGNVYQGAWAAADTKLFQRMVSVALSCSGLVTILLGCSALLFLAADGLTEILSIKALPHADAIAVAVMMGAVTLSRIARGAISQIYRGRQEFAIGIIVDLLPGASTLVITIALGLMGAAPVIVASAYLASDLITGWGAMFWNLNKRYPDLQIKPALPTRPELRDLIHHVKWFSVQQSGPVAWLQVPVLVLGHVGVASASLVSFVVLRTLVNFLRGLGTMVSLGSGVEIVSIHNAGRTDEAIRNLQTVGRGLSVFSASMAVGMVTFGHPLVTLWTGREELYDCGVLFSLLASAALATPSAPMASHLTFANTPRPLSIALLIQYAIGLSACAALARTCGAVGVAAGLALGEVIGQGFVLPVLAAKHLTGFGASGYYVSCLLAMIWTAIWCGGVGLGALTIFDTSRSLGLIAAGAAWTVLGFVPAVALALPTRQREWFAARLGLPGPRARKSIA